MKLFIHFLISSCLVSQCFALDRITQYCMDEYSSDYIACLEEQKKLNNNFLNMVVIYQDITGDMSYDSLIQCTNHEGNVINDYLCMKKKLIDLYKQK